MSEKKLLLTINYSFTYEVAITTDTDLETLKAFPKSKDKLPAVLVSAIEFPHDNKHCELVNKSIEILDVVEGEVKLKDLDS